MSTLTWRSHAAPLPAIGVITALLALVLIATISFSSITDFKRRAAWVAHTNDVISRIEEISSLLKDAQSATRGFVLTGLPTFLAPYTAAQQALPERIAALTILVSDNPTQQQSMVILKALSTRALLIHSRLLELQRSNPDAAVATRMIASGDGDAAMNRIRALASQMIAYERQLLAQREVDAESSLARARILILLGALVGAGISGGSLFLLGLENRKRRAADQALVNANKDLLQRAGQLEATNKELESFSYSISHDLRIPLRAVSGYVRMFEEDYGDRIDAEGQRLLGVVRDNTKRMGDLIDDLLAFSRLGRQAMRPGDIDMQALVASVIAPVRQGGEFPDSVIEVGSLPAAYGDRMLLQQVWINLISNALKYSAATAQPRIAIGGQVTAYEIIYQVADNGVGFDMQYYDKLFGVFQRLHSADEFPGTGVGLAIAHRIVTRHGGRIWAEAVPGSGATFFFALPRQEPNNG